MRISMLHVALELTKASNQNRNEHETMTPVLFSNDHDVGYDWIIKVFVKQHRHIVTPLLHAAALLLNRPHLPFYSTHYPPHI